MSKDLDVKVTPKILSGTVRVPASKSILHRMLICATLVDESKGISTLNGITLSLDIQATINALTALGAKIDVNNDDTITVRGIAGEIVDKIGEYCSIDCGESGSTLRFLIPIAAVLGRNTTFLGRGKLPTRPITPYLRELIKTGVKFEYNNNMPFTVGGRLSAGSFSLEGDISSQFITGLLMALPLCDEDSAIKLISPLQSKPYVDMTLDCLKKFGVKAVAIPNTYLVKGQQSFSPCIADIEGDYSQAAFFFVANALGCNIKVDGLNKNSLQGDKKVLEILENIGYNNNSNEFMGFELDASNIPDIIPVMTVLGCFGQKPSRIYNASRLRIKESNRLNSIATTLNQIGGDVVELEDGLVINPIKEFVGGVVDSFNDHRIVMALAIASVKSKNPITIRGAEAVDKSYHNFFRDFNKIGGSADVISLE